MRFSQAKKKHWPSPTSVQGFLPRTICGRRLEPRTYPTRKLLVSCKICLVGLGRLERERA